MKKRRIVTFLIIGIFMAASIVPAISSFNPSMNKTIYVDDDNTEGPWDGTQQHPYQHIQDAVDNASTGDTVFVYNGVYKQNITVNVSIQLIGEDMYHTIITGGNESFFYINANEVSVSHVTIEGDEFIFAILGPLEEDNFFTEHIEIHDTIINCISFFDVSKSTISNNYFYDNGYCFILGSNNLILGNTFKNMSDGLTLIDFGFSGIKQVNNTVKKNVFQNNEIGLMILTFDYHQTNKIIMNNFINNTRHALGHIILDFNATENILQSVVGLSNPEKKYLLDRVDSYKRKSSEQVDVTMECRRKDIDLFSRQWNHNYWDNWMGFGPKIIPCTLHVFIGERTLPLPWFQCDWHPAREPFDLSGEKPLKISLSDAVVYEGETFTVTITSKKNPMDDVIVSFAEMIASTDVNGQATFTAPDPGVESAVYAITAIKEGYMTAETSITVIKG
jgi:hypothetical protein